jgi:hypothetical protein
MTPSEFRSLVEKLRAAQRRARCAAAYYHSADAAAAAGYERLVDLALEQMARDEADAASVHDGWKEEL